LEFIRSSFETVEQPSTSHERRVIDTVGHAAFIVLYLLQIIFFVLFYDSAGLVVLLYIGWGVLVVGTAFLISASNSRKKGNVSKEGGTGRTVLVESGLYAFVRNPEFLGHLLIILALVFLAQKWFSVVTCAAMIALFWIEIALEEKRDVEKFGDEYEDYMRRVPRINLLVGILRHRGRKRKIKA